MAVGAVQGCTDSTSGRAEMAGGEADLVSRAANRVEEDEEPEEEPEPEPELELEPAPAPKSPFGSLIMYEQ
jgi:hypothetical protein